MKKKIQIISDLNDISDLDGTSIVICFDINLQNKLKEKNIKYVYSFVFF